VQQPAAGNTNATSEGERLKERIIKISIRRGRRHARNELGLKKEN